MKSTLQLPLLVATIILSLISSAAVLPAETVAQEVKTYAGMCDASGAVALDDNRFIVANDEPPNILRIYDKNVITGPLQEVPLSGVFSEIQDGDNLEIDMEGAARLGNKFFWIGSHSTSRTGKFRAARHRLFAVQINPGDAGKFVVTRSGKIYTSLVADLEKDSRFNVYKINEAKAIKPKDIGGLSIEGLAATPKGTLLIGFRNPLSGGAVKEGKLIGGKALIVSLLNPLDVIEGQEAKFGDPIELDLGGYGIRSIEFLDKDEYLIVAGPYHENLVTEGQKREESRLYIWSNKSNKAKPLDNIKLGELNIEAAFFYLKTGKGFVQLLSDDGKPVCNNGFRSLWQKL